MKGIRFFYFYFLFFFKEEKKEKKKSHSYAITIIKSCIIYTEIIYKNYHHKDQGIL